MTPHGAGTYRMCSTPHYWAAAHPSGGETGEFLCSSGVTVP